MYRSWELSFHRCTLHDYHQMLVLPCTYKSTFGVRTRAEFAFREELNVWRSSRSKEWGREAGGVNRFQLIENELCMELENHPRNNRVCWKVLILPAKLLGSYSLIRIRIRVALRFTTHKRNCGKADDVWAVKIVRTPEIRNYCTKMANWSMCSFFGSLAEYIWYLRYDRRLQTLSTVYIEHTYKICSADRSKNKILKRVTLLHKWSSESLNCIKKPIRERAWKCTRTKKSNFGHKHTHTQV